MSGHGLFMEMYVVLVHIQHVNGWIADRMDEWMVTSMDRWMADDRMLHL